jgi:hypothetical protein
LAQNSKHHPFLKKYTTGTLLKRCGRQVHSYVFFLLMLFRTVGTSNFKGDHSQTVNFIFLPLQNHIVDLASGYWVFSVYTCILETGLKETRAHGPFVGFGSTRNPLSPQ